MCVVSKSQSSNHSTYPGSFKLAESGVPHTPCVLACCRVDPCSTIESSNGLVLQYIHARLGRAHNLSALFFFIKNPSTVCMALSPTMGVVKGGGDQPFEVIINEPKLLSFNSGTYNMSAP